MMRLALADALLFCTLNPTMSVTALGCKTVGEKMTLPNAGIALP
jgi:hypothetical protein